MSSYPDADTLDWPFNFDIKDVFPAPVSPTTSMLNNGSSFTYYFVSLQPITSD
jgi:hypothetical protein